eukprot:6197012-Pleurochrysis_carterae.AAC.1
MSGVSRIYRTRSGCGRYSDWEGYLETKGCAQADCVKPDVIHANSSCKEHSVLRFLGSGLLGPEPKPHVALLQATIHRLQSHQRERLRLSGVHVPGSIENVQGANPIFDGFGYPQVQLCGTMLGHRVFFHRLFMCSDEVSLAVTCNHDGKHIGSRGHALTDRRETNMYGPYSWHRSSIGKATNCIVPWDLTREVLHIELRPWSLRLRRVRAIGLKYLEPTTPEDWAERAKEAGEDFEI